jgi:hypothetical protein
LQIDDGNNAIVMRVTTPARQRQQHHHNEGNYVITKLAKMSGLQKCLHINGSITITTKAMTLA